MLQPHIATVQSAVGAGLPTRQLFTCGTFMLVAAVFAALGTATAAGSASFGVAGFTAVVCFHTMFSPGYQANYLDVGGQNSGILSSFGNTLANLPFNTLLTAWFLDDGTTDGGWAGLFLFTAALYALQAVAYWRFSSIAEVTPRAKQQ